MYFSFGMSARPKIPAKKSGSTRSEFCEILSPVTDIFLLKNSATPTRLVRLRPCESVPPFLTPSISQNFARVPHLHFCTPHIFKRLRGVQRFPALLLQQKHHASRGGASARGERYDTLFWK